MLTETLPSLVAAAALASRYDAVRRFSEDLARPLSAEDCNLQSMPDASPTKWHLAHTTWFFETFVLARCPGFRPFDESFAYLFNSYYNTIGAQFSRPRRGMISRPGLTEALEYRRVVDEQILDLLESESSEAARFAATIEIGLHHEQQHQELILTDIKHALAQNPLQPVYRDGRFGDSPAADPDGWSLHDEGVYRIGYDAGDDFAFDNESPRHRVFLEEFEISNRLVTCGEYLHFMEDGGYERPELWLSLGWDAVRREGWTGPLYWSRTGNKWREFTLAGAQTIDLHRPVCHVSYFEADAFARWAGARLPTEAEWEVAAGDDLSGNFVGEYWEAGTAIHPGCRPALGAALPRIYGDVWEWTASPYVAYPGYAPPAGALGEYNGKFMCNQFVLRGGSCATSSTHIRRTYRNFFPPESRWQFSGIRLCR
ncbi:MAG: ergothioneine biosynthesis protein EgtB [Planctomycetota bacterium]|nr:MAG: ergothioneine biosynthesis protein EgtB [Planctomycetota bacterium]REK24371.1 MAG: ergothioneine biosynthesis protein EgtB [Planctomycetota bacterium]REK38562.1 MAG: ergothioneine biosynthesis protein EgtB [Planctomycetota bacterium]